MINDYIACLLESFELVALPRTARLDNDCYEHHIRTNNRASRCDGYHLEHVDVMDTT